MTNIDLYNNCKEKLSSYLDGNNNKLIILSGSGGNGKSTLLNELKDKISDKRYTIMRDVSKTNLLNLNTVHKLDDFVNIILEITGDLDDFTSDHKHLHINMNNIHF